jgi:hypothetical protein
MKKTFQTLFVLLLCATQKLSAQTQGIAYTAAGKGVATTFVTDYHCLGINPSALGWGTGYVGKKFTVGATEFGFGIYSDSLNSDRLKNMFKAFRGQADNSNPQSMDWAAQKEAVARYAQAGVSIFLDFNWAGFAYQSPKFGGIAFNIKENYQWYSQLNQTTTDIVFRGKLSSYFDSLTVVFGSDTSQIANYENMSQDSLAAVIAGKISSPLSLSSITKGSSIKLSWTRSYNFGYGRKLIGNDSTFAIYGGVGGRFIQSMAMFNLESDERGLYMYTSLSPAFDVNYGAVANANLSGLSGYKGGIPPVVGNGYGVDVSASMIVFGKLKVAASVNNIGSVTYKRNVYTVKDTLLGGVSIPGLADGDITQAINQLLQEGGILKLEAEEKYVLANAADFRFGASFQPFRQLNFGFDMVAPFHKENPGSIQNAVFSFGGDFRPVKWLQLSAGYYGGGIYRSNIPVGINFILKNGSYEFGISSRDALSFFTKKSNSISTAFGFARFRF